MQMKKLDCSALPVCDILSLLEITRDYCGTAPTWQTLRPALERNEAWGFYRRKQLVAYGLFAPSDRRLAGSVTLTCLRYGWQENSEASLGEMMALISATLAPRFCYLLMDVSRCHEPNLELYRALGFCDSMLPSQKGKGNVVLLARLADFPSEKKKKG